MSPTTIMRKSILSTWLFVTVILTHTYGQPDSETLSRQDTLRGTVTPERAWWNVLNYDLSVQPDFPTRTIRGQVVIHFRADSAGKVMQIDLQQPMQIEKIMWQGQSLERERDGNVYFVKFPEVVKQGSEHDIIIHYSGKPRKAINPPWDGGWIWTKDLKGRPWMSVACQGLGASVWFPCKDHQSDEPDRGATIRITVPDTLTAIANGRLVETITEGEGMKTFVWTVTSPINNYNIIPYIGKYVTWSETFAGEGGTLDCSYWVLDYELAKAKEQFKQVPKMLTCFEHWLGPFPFYADGYKLVQSPHLGMEHQSAVAYGNEFRNGYLGRDLSQSGWGLKWDFIIIHESGHEWFGNNITTHDIADMWVHEGFTNYTETLFTTCEYGVEAGSDYLTGIRQSILNDTPVIGPYGVNKEGSRDMYYKGANLVHIVRQVVNDDEKFRQILRGMNRTFRHSIVTSRQVEAYINETTGTDFSKVFDQYLRTTQIPVLEYKLAGEKLQYRWANCVEGFNLPVKIDYNGTRWIRPEEKWQELKVEKGGKEISIDRNFYVALKNVGTGTK